MPLLSIVFGLALVGLGLLGYYQPTTLGDVGEKGVSPTALIPAAIGAILALAGVVVLLKPGARKHAMHVAAMFGLIGAAGGFMPLFRSNMDFSKSAAVSGLCMIILCAAFVILCVRSFIQARLARASQLPTPGR